MKKIFLSAAMLAMITVGCTNEEIVKVEQSQMISIEASYGADSRTTINDTKTVWQPGDQIFVSSADGKCWGTLTLEGNSGGSNGKFTGFVSGDPADLAYSVFPVPTDGVIDLTKRSADSPDAPMIATFGANKTSLSFDLTCGMVAVKINGAEGKSVVLTNDDLGLGGTAVVVYNETTKKYELNYTRTSTSENGVTITGIPSSEALVYIPVITSDGEGNELPATGNINLEVAIGNASTVINVPVAEGKVSLEQVPEITYDAVKNEIEKEGTVIPDAQKTPEEALREAMKSDDKVITLSTDVVLTSPLMVTKAKVLDLAGFKITNSAEKFDTTEEDALVIVKRDASLTINDSQNSGEIAVTNNDGIYSAIKMTASTEENDGPEAALVINGGHISGTYYGISGNGKRNGTSVIINGGKIQCTSKGSGIFQPQDGYLEINGGEIIGLESAVEVRAGRMVMNGGTLKCETEFNKPEGNISGTTMRGGVALGIARHITGNDIEVEINGGELVVPVNSEGNTYYGIYEYSQEGVAGKAKICLKDASYKVKAESADLICQVTKSETLTKAVDLEANNIKVELLNDIKGNAVVPQNNGVDIVIDGKEYKYDGTIYIDGKNNGEGEESVKLANINFETETPKTFVTYASNPSGHASTYPHNITIDHCDFKAIVSGTAYNDSISGISFTSPYNLTVSHCTAENMHSLLQAQSCDNTVAVENVTVTNCKSGISFGNTASPSISNSTINSVGQGGYGIRCDGDKSRGKLKVTGCNVSGENPIVVRKMTTSYSAELSGNNSISARNTNGYQIIFTNGNDGTYETPTGSFTITGAEGFKVFPESKE